jgi:type IV pilus assembly protein PilY1
MFKNQRSLLSMLFNLLLLMTMATATYADDTELYSASYQAGTTGKPKVLVVFDDSGSMSTVVQGSKPDYDPSATYVTKVPANRIYWSASGSPPNVNGSEANQWFPASANSCATSATPLAEQGTFLGAAQRWQPATGSWVTTTTRICTRWFWIWCQSWVDEPGPPEWQGTPAGWVDLTPGVNNPYTVDCNQDVTQQNSGNAGAIGNGYPRAAGAPDSSNADAYTPLVNNSNVNWGAGRTFYTSHYMNWYYDNTIVTQDKDYLQIAQEVIENIIRANPAIDFGLAVFNHNTSSSDNGGRIVRRIIQNMSATDRENMITTLWGFDHQGNTPLCETAWETYLYMSGGNRKYGISGNSIDRPLRDAAAESGGRYISPLEECSNTYVIFMTDGEPTQDTDANTLIRNLTGRSQCPTYSTGSRTITSCLAPLTEYMADTDLDRNAGNGFQTVKTATIGFNVNGPGWQPGDPVSSADALLSDAATLVKSNGDPAYYYAESADKLTESFNEIILGILSTETTFTSPAVAVDTFTRTQSRDDVFFAMFEPGLTADWWGNIKKFKVDESQNAIVDSTNTKAFNTQGLIKDSAKSFWSATSDGPSVDKGGVGGQLKARVLSTRSIVTNTGAAGALEPLTTANVDAAAYGFGTSAALHAFWQVSNASDFEKSIRYGWGYDVDDLDSDGNTTETRQWILADILHSKPLVINYGALGSFTKANPDMRIVVGTNNGMLHMFGNNDGEEDWAFFPKELGPVLTKRRKNIRNGKNVYGIDSPVAVYTIDVNHDGTLDHTAGDKVYLYFGLRRGGNMLYALDVSNPDSPAFMWNITAGSAGFGEMGQTWSVPVLKKIPGYKDGSGKPKTVLIFGAGYDPAKDDHTTLADTGLQDSSGRGLFIVDAVTGNLVWSVTPQVDSATNLQELGLVHSVAADVTTLDSNGDSLVDRIYFADTGGIVWRVDLPGNTRPTSSQDTWSITKLFEAAEGARTSTTDRRFFNAPDVVRTTVGGYPVDAVLIGSGDRTNPIARDNPNNVNDRTVDDQFYLIKDRRTLPYLAPLAAGECSSGTSNDFRCNLPLHPDDLYDNTSNDIQDGNEEERNAAMQALAQADGWALNLTANGEKALARSLTIGNQLFFTTFSPETELAGCGFSAGNGRLYAIDLLTGTAVRDFDGDGDYERSWIIGGLIPQTPSPYFASDSNILLLLPPGDSGEASATGNPFSTGTTLPGPYGSYWHREDY